MTGGPTRVDDLDSPYREVQIVPPAFRQAARTAQVALNLVSCFYTSRPWSQTDTHDSVTARCWLQNSLTRAANHVTFRVRSALESLNFITSWEKQQYTISWNKKTTETSDTACSAPDSSEQCQAPVLCVG